MGLTARAVLPFLVEKGVVARSELLIEEWTVVPQPRRHRNFEVRRGCESGYFLKHADPSVNGAARTLHREAEVGWLAQHDPAFYGLREVVPATVLYDPARHVLVSDLIARGVPLSAVDLAAARASARAIGRALARAHRAGADPRRRRPGPMPFTGSLPWLLRSVSDPRRIARLRSSSARAFLSFVRGDPVLHRGLRELAERYRRQCLVHGDLKRDNVVLRDDGTVRIVDWELADWGDPAWDLGALVLALRNDPAACRELVRGYGVRDADSLDRAAASAAARALQVGYECGAGSPSRPHAAHLWIDRARAIFRDRASLLDSAEDAP